MKGKWFAAYWDWQLRSEPPKVRAMREAVVGGARGRVLEIGCGPGPNFSYYSDQASAIVATDPNPFMLPRAEKRAATETKPIEVRRAAAEGLPFSDDEFDTVVSRFNMCSVADPAKAVIEIQRDVKDAGRNGV